MCNVLYIVVCHFFFCPFFLLGIALSVLLRIRYLQTPLSYIIVRKTYYNCESVESFLVDLVTQTGRQRTGDTGNIVRPMVNIDIR